MLDYPVILHKDDNDTVMVTAPDFPEVTTFGDDVDDAMARAVDALEEAIAGRIADREDIPEPSKGKIRVALPTQTGMKVLLYQRMRDRGLRKSDLGKRLSWRPMQVDRLLDLRHASRLDQFDRAFRALDAELNVEVSSIKGEATGRWRRPRRRTAPKVA